ncbi:hypothetical protein B9Z19DRAFT_1081804 [Tuber borchii]|uniref:Uncharacterized protein n=1 Tax=Tuber borchii TaxID=42251 RepID=A0A2T6ZV66_TUBBO|nr:hypothetical protein B9Z19DRAFT_1081804 [Tuber borchii]
MALQSRLKGVLLCQVFLDVWKALTLNPDSWSVSILHGATESSKGGGILLGFFSPGCLESADFKARFREREACDHGALKRWHSTRSHLSTTKRASPYKYFPWCY